MLPQAKKELRDLIAGHRLDRFFERWADLVHEEADGTQLIILRQSDWNGLKREERMGTIGSEAAGLRRARIVNALLAAVSELEEGDLRGAAGSSTTPAAPRPPSDNSSLQDLMRRKLEMLERERLLATDASVKFKLDEEIRELRERLG